MTDFVTRFAPSPTGELHLGSAYSAMLAFESARAVGGRCLLRIEDVDHTRCRAEYTDSILDVLAWLGLNWDTPVRRQSDHIDDYRKALKSLEKRGLVYRCFKSRAEIEAERIARGIADDDVAIEGVGIVYRGPATPLTIIEEREKLDAGAPYAWRLSLARAKKALGETYDTLSYCEEGEDGRTPRARQAPPDNAGDVVLWRKDGAPSYHLAVVHDDALQGVTHVIRGEDLESSTPIHVLLQRLLDLPTPIYRHHRLLVGSDNKRYSKRDQSLSIRALRNGGATPSDIRDRIENAL